MGCVVTSEKKAGTSEGPKVPVAKFRFGSPDYDVFGVGTDKTKIESRPIFELGRTVIFLLVAPAVHEQVAEYATDAKTEAEEAKAEGQEEAAAATDNAAAPPAPPAPPAPAASKEQEKPPVRWALYNDGKPDAQFHCTFFHAENVKVLDTSATKENRMDGHRLQTEVSVAGGKTVAYVEGPIGGYMWRCAIKDAEGNYQPAHTYEETL